MTRPFQNESRCPTHLAVLDIESIAPLAPDGESFPPWPTHEPVVASILLCTAKRYGQWQFDLESVTFEDAKSAIERISHLVEGRTVVGFNSRNFDILVLARVAR